VSRVIDEPRVAVMVRDVARLSRDLGITTIAEGVETAATAETLGDLGIDWGKGIISRHPPSLKPRVSRRTRSFRTGSARRGLEAMKHIHVRWDR